MTTPPTAGNAYSVSRIDFSCAALHRGEKGRIKGNTNSDQVRIMI